MWNFARAVADNTNPRSLAARLRRRRMLTMIRLTGLRAEHAVLDVGGSEQLWRIVRWPGRVDLLNTRVPMAATPGGRFRRLVGDGCRLDFGDGTYDLVFSNSTIEHVGGPERARAFASEARRVGKGYWVQAPCFGFPVEPHFLFPLFHCLPPGVRAWIAPRWPLGWSKRAGAPRDELRSEALSLWLPRVRDMRAMFPDGRLWVERFIGFVKSVSAYRPLPQETVD